MNHVNIVRYYNSWLEVIEKKPKNKIEEKVSQFSNK